jgi:sec-independent protein translocase protein TatC
VSTQDQPEEAEIEASRAPLMDHLIELRSRLIVSSAALFVAFAGCFGFSTGIFLFLVEPFIAAMKAFNKGRPATEIDLYNTHAFGFFFVKMQVSLFAAVIIAFPVIAWQVYAFIAPGLYKRERQAALPFLLAAPVMFLLGSAFVYYVAMPYALEFALNQQVTMGQIHVKYLPKVDEYLSLVTTLVLAFGLCFQMPVVFSLLARVGVLDASALRKFRRYAIVGIAFVAACVTPPDVLSMTFMFIPMYALYEISILLVWFISSARAREEAAATGA